MDVHTMDLVDSWILSESIDLQNIFHSMKIHFTSNEGSYNLN